MKISAPHSAFQISTAWLLLASAALATDHHEATQGDLSNNRSAPTTINLTVGSNHVSGTFGMSAVPNVLDLDYLTVVVPTGTKLTEVILTDLRAGGGNSFLGVEVGPVMTFPPTSFDPTPLLAYGHIYNNQVNSDLLPAIGLNEGLAAGTFTFWMNETDGGEPYPYALNFKVQATPPVPVPAITPWSAAVATVALLGAGAFHLRRRAAIRRLQPV